jgi:class 3 adenylate cyclase
VGTTIFLFSDILGSTALWQKYPAAMPGALARHHTLVGDAIQENGGYIFQIVGDAFCAAFSTATAALAAAWAGQRALLAEQWLNIEPLRARMGIHAGPAEVNEADLRAGQYTSSLTLSRAARLMASAHGGQVLVSAAVEALASDFLPPGLGLRELGTHRLRDMVSPERIYQLIASDLPADFPPIRATDAPLTNLPTHPTTLIGREAELSAVLASLRSEEVRLLTLTGPGGIGKTRLALQAATKLLDHFADGFCFVDLAPIRDSASVLDAIARTVGVKEGSDRPLLEELKGQLQSKKMLLLLDNFEQVTEAAPRVVELLRESSQLKLLVTSREALHTSGEYVFPMPPLAFPKVDLKHPSMEQVTCSLSVPGQ